MHDPVAIACARLFRKAADLDNSPIHASMTDAQILIMPIDDFGIDSLTTMEFIMELENQLNVTLNEEDVNRCGTIAELAALASNEQRV